jgi:hypothetical protein
MSGLAVFGLKYPSLLKFDEHRSEVRIRANLKSLYGVEQAPCDTQLRTVLDRINPAEVPAPFIRIHQPLYQQKFLEDFLDWGDCLISIDGTGQFSSSLVHGPACCSRHYQKGPVGYDHQR